MPARELAALQSILNQVLAKAAAKRVRSAQLARGELCELGPAAIQKYWEELSRGTSAERAQLHFRLIEAEVQCMACFGKYRPQAGEIHCPYCGSCGAKILAGEEFYLESIDLDDE